MQIVSMNPFRPLYDACNTGDPAEKWASLADFPRMIDIELTSACNFRCLMCPTGNLSLQRKPVFMGWELHASIAVQCANAGTAIRYIGWGEPLLHPDAPKMIAQAAECGLLTHLNTNGSLVDYPMADRLVAAGLDSIKFSFQGVDRESYREMRAVDFFDGLVQAIWNVHEVRDAKRRPWIAASTSVTDEGPGRIEMFRDRVAPLVDELTIGTTIFDYMDLSAVRLRPADKARLAKLKAREITEKRHPVPCPEVYDKLSIHADGSVVVCCNDFDGIMELGNVNDTPIVELWRHPKIEAYRERLARKDYDAPLCKDCFDYMGCVSKARAA